MLASGVPDLAPYGLPHMYLARESDFEFETPGDSSTMATQASVEAIATDSLGEEYVCLDLEHWSTAPSDVNQSENLARYLQVLEWFRAINSESKVGFWGRPPKSQLYWAAQNTTTSDYLNWLQWNDDYAQLADAVDVIFPSAYVEYHTISAYKRGLAVQLSEAAKYGKPIIPWVSPNYIYTGGEELSRRYWNTVLSELTSNPLVSGIVIWTGPLKTWDATDQWWIDWLDFTRQKGTFAMKRLGIGFCLNGIHSGNTVLPHISMYPADCFLFTGDNGYYDKTTQNVYGDCTDLSTDLATLLSESERQCHSEYFLAQPGPAAIMRNVPSVHFMYDDHEILNNFRNAPENIDEELGLAGGTATAQNLADLKTVFRAVWDDYYKSFNPENTDFGIDADAAYFRFTLGNAEIFVLDCTLYKTTWVATDASYDAGNITMLGPLQKQWLKDRLRVSTSPLKIIVMTKTIFGDTDATNVDAWPVHYADEQNELLAFVEAASGWVAPGGVVWVGGDRHNSQVQVSSNLVMINAGPIGEGMHSSGSNNADVIYRQDTELQSTMIEIYNDHMMVYALGPLGQKRCGVRVDAGELTASTQQDRSAI